MLFGMGTVITFLTLLVVAIGLMHRLLERFYPAPAAVASADGAAVPHDGAAQKELVAVIAAAVHRHRQQSSSSRMRQEDAPHG